MSNVAFDLEVFKQVSGSVPNPGPDKIGALGALGPDLYQYLPISKKLSDALDKVVQKSLQAPLVNNLPQIDLTPITNDAALAAELFEKPLMTAYSILFRQIVVPFWPIFQRDIDLLNQLQTAANNQDGDALKQLASELDQLQQEGDAVKKLAPLAKVVTVLIALIPSIPPSIESTNPAAKPWLPSAYRLFEFLRWQHTDGFAQNLVKLADTANKKAYAYGYLIHVAASVTGKPFINNISGGPYRTHWWRDRLVSNHVDSWTFGRYETSGVTAMTSDTPNIPYASWKNIVSSNLQNRFNLANLSAPAGSIPDAVTAVANGVDTGALWTSLTGAFPTEISDYIQKAIDGTYPVALRPPGYTTDAIKQSFVGLFAVVWFMTSGFGPMTPFDLGAAPSSCQSEPTWVQQGGSPPSPQQSGPSTGATVCGVLLAILALILLIFEDWGDGVAAVVGAVKAFTSGGGIDWDTLQCDLFWVRKLLLKAQEGLVDGLVKAALAYPSPGKLGTTDVNNVTHPVTDLGGVPLTKTNFSTAATAAIPLPYPHQMDKKISNAADLNFGQFPASPLETPETLNFPLPPSYPDKIVDGSGIQNGGMLTNGTFPSRNKFFGDAVANAKQVVGDQAGKLPRYNLDADRGYGWKTWSPKVNTFPGNGSVDNPNPGI